MSVRFGYKASAEQFGPVELLELTVLAEKLGFDSVAVSDHFQPWRHHGGHSPATLAWLGAAGQRTERILLGTSVLTPTFRYHPSVVAQAVATLACLTPSRLFLGVGTGEAMNEIPATRGEWPEAKERRLRLAEAIELMRLLWTEERVTFEGQWYRTDRATLYDRPAELVPVYVAASGPLAAKLAGRTGDGFICTSGKRPELYGELLAAVEEGAEAGGRDAAAIDRMIEIKISYGPDLGTAKADCAWWAALALSPEEKMGVDDAVEMERLADLAVDRAHTRFIVADDPEEAVDRVGWYVDLGFDHLVFHLPSPDQRPALELFARDVLPRMRERWGATAAAR